MQQPRTTNSSQQLEQQAELIALRVAAALRGELKEMNQALTRLEEQAQTDSELVEKHEHLLYGNGQEGLTTKISKLVEANAQRNTIITAAAVILTGTAIGAFVYLVVTHPMSVLP